MLRKPNLKVIDRAISIIQDGENRLFAWDRRRSKYSCLAIEGAGNFIHGKIKVWGGSMRVGTYSSPRGEAIQQYKTQYEKFVRSQNGGKLPRWWNNVNYSREHRINALKAFKQACIDAGKKAKQC